MIKTGVVVCLFSLASSFGLAQNPDSSSHGSKTLLLALESAWNRAQLQHDSKALDGLLAGTFISTDNDGTFMTKAQFLADNSDLSYAASLMTNSDEQVLYENAAVVAGTYHAKGSDKVSPSTITGDSPTPGSIQMANGCALPLTPARSRSRG